MYRAGNIDRLLVLRLTARLRHACEDSGELSVPLLSEVTAEGVSHQLHAAAPGVSAPRTLHAIWRVGRTLGLVARSGAVDTGVWAVFMAFAARCARAGSGGQLVYAIDAPRGRDAEELPERAMVTTLIHLRSQTLRQCVCFYRTFHGRLLMEPAVFTTPVRDPAVDAFLAGYGCPDSECRFPAAPMFVAELEDDV